MNLRKTAILGLIVMSVGCVFSESGNNDGWKFGEDAGDSGTHDSGGSDSGEGDSGGSDMGSPDGGGPDVGPPPREVTFRLINNSSAPVFAYQGVYGGLNCDGGAWLEVLEGGESRRITSDCSRCSCDDAPNCTVCAIDCAPGADPEYSQLSVGGARTFDWNGLLRVDTEVDGTMCETERPPRGELSARFCWGTSFETTFEPRGEIRDVRCEEVPFALEQGVVEFEIPDSAPAEPLAFRMVNETNETLYAHYSAGGPCSFGTWLSMTHNSNDVDFLDECGTCSCADVNNPDRCPEICPQFACAAPTREAFEFRPGDLREFLWNRVAFVTDSVDNMMCERDILLTGPTTATFCWARDVDPNFVLIGEECETIDFDPQTATEVRHLVLSQP